MWKISAFCRGFIKVYISDNSYVFLQYKCLKRNHKSQWKIICFPNYKPWYVIHTLWDVAFKDTLVNQPFSSLTWRVTWNYAYSPFKGSSLIWNIPECTVLENTMRYMRMICVPVMRMVNLGIKCKQTYRNNNKQM